MKRLALAALAILALSYPVIAQTPQPAANSPGNSAVKSTDSPQPGSPVKGANSFTESQAKARIEERLFKGIRLKERRHWHLARASRKKWEDRQRQPRFSRQHFLELKKIKEWRHANNF